jgi:hypothetical protein
LNGRKVNTHQSAHFCTLKQKNFYSKIIWVKMIFSGEKAQREIIGRTKTEVFGKRSKINE